MKTQMLPPEHRRLPLLGLLAAALPAALGIGVADNVQAQEKLVAEYSWKALADAGKVDASLLHEETGRGTVCKIVNPASEPVRKTLLTIEAPAITADFYRLEGEIRYEAVEGDSYLEMWSTFPPAVPGGPERSYFSRTLADNNQMGKLHGTSDWREFALPFNAAGSGAHPTRLTFNLVLVSKGTVAISGVKLWQTFGGAAALPQSWETALHAGGGMFPALSLGVCGGVGAIIVSAVALCEWMAAQSRGQAVVLVIGTLTSTFSLLPLLAGFWLRQAQAVSVVVWAPWLVCGLLGVVLPPIRLLTLHRLSRQREMRRMAALDALT